MAKLDEHQRIGRHVKKSHRLLDTDNGVDVIGIDAVAFQPSSLSEGWLSAGWLEFFFHESESELALMVLSDMNSVRGINQKDLIAVLDSAAVLDIQNSDDEYLLLDHDGLDYPSHTSMGCLNPDTDQVVFVKLAELTRWYPPDSRHNSKALNRT